jgi:hypothetical protein
MNENNELQPQQCLDDSIKELSSVNRKLSKLALRKEELAELIINVLGHNHEGQRTYEHSRWKIEVKTPFSYSLNKKLYESGTFVIPEQYNPIKQGVTYTVNARNCDKFLEEAPREVRDMLAELIDKKPGKASVTLKERV